MKPLITLVVPCYNVEAYLDHTMDSVVKQSYGNLDIILVNDGSVDGTAELCEKWAGLDSRIRVVHQENGGLSHARNVGISMAKGRYISFVDADDRIDLSMIEILYDLLVKYDAQISACLWENLYEDSIIIPQKEVYEKVFGRKEAIASALKGKELSCGATGKLYETRLFDQVLFPLGVTIEDAYIIMKLYLQCERVAFISQGLYFYYHREGSIMHSGFSEKDFNVIKAHEGNRKIILDVYPELSLLVEQRIAWAYLHVYDKLTLSDVEDRHLRRNLKKEVLKRTGVILKGDYFNKGRKLAVLALRVSPRIYRKLVMQRTKRYLAHSSS